MTNYTNEELNKSEKSEKKKSQGSAILQKGLYQLCCSATFRKRTRKAYIRIVWRKNNLGGLKHRTVRRKQVEHYANKTCPERCLVNLFKIYMEKCPKAAIEHCVLSPRRKYELSDKGIHIYMCSCFDINTWFFSRFSLKC